MVTKRLKREIWLCYGNTTLPTMIGCNSQYYYQKIKRKYKNEDILRKEKQNIIKENIIYLRRRYMNDLRKERLFNVNVISIKKNDIMLMNILKDLIKR